jgi:alanine dehydrogenase
VFSPTPEKRHAFVDQARKAFPFAVEEASSVRAAADGANIVTLVTRAREPFLDRTMLASGAHLNAVGAILPQGAEFAQDVFGAAALICVDSVAGVQENSSEFRTWLGADADRAASILPLSKLLASAPSRRHGDGITLFKAMGMGISDLAVAQLAIERARQRGVGMPMPDVKRSSIRWRALENAQRSPMGGAQHV